ncbi:prepilin-type N-terminal cleavage/methylation domain-containing protein [Conexibacter sp. SYSU D00693]|uniref:type IV pilus modification PilV family protein n=1 Tax=Conexibacter sp. SYSU D00693 TaxID=2812560 RepID=UPI00196A7FA7|nr:prepilin-type N-terminal cleavage/methylation domain-containing protein [Conexibacter sp. SYSU D00693]
MAVVLRRLRRDQAGFTLLEVLAAMVVLAVGVLPAMEVFTRGHQTASTAQNVQVASNVATEAIEELRALPYAKLAAGAIRQVATPGGVEGPGRLGAGTYAMPATDQEPAHDEPLVPASTDASAPPSYERVTVKTDEGARTVDVWRVASFRTESCPVLDLSALLARIGPMRDAIAALLSTSGGALGELVGADGTGGLLGKVVTDTQGAQAKLTGLVMNLLGALVGQKTQAALQASLTAVQGGTAPLRASLATLRASLASFAAKLAELQTRLSGDGALGGKVLDLCQLPDDGALPDLRDLATVHDALGPLTTQLEGLLSGTSSLSAKVTSLSTSLGNVVGGLLGGLLSTISGQADAVSSAAQALGLPVSLSLTAAGGDQVSATPRSGALDLATLVDRQLGRTGDLLSLLTTGNARNTVRVTVAVRVVGSRDTGPQRPIWVSTVITNPGAHVL